MFETDKEVLDWYERQPRALSKEYVNSIRWKEIKNYPINPAFVPVLIYMRDIEYFTDMYYQELRRTPTGKDPIIKKFMDRWSIEELHHGNLLNRFLEEAGIPTGKNWQAEATRKIPRLYTIGSYLVDHASRPFGKYFHGAHMVWGAINEITAMNAYRRLSDLADHPVLEQLLIGIVQEESIHSSFYWNVARVKLARDEVFEKPCEVHHRKILEAGGAGSQARRRSKLRDGDVVARQRRVGSVRSEDRESHRALAGFRWFQGIDRTSRADRAGLTCSHEMHKCRVV